MLSPFDLLAEFFSCIQILHGQSCCKMNIQFHIQEEKIYYKGLLDSGQALFSFFSSHDSFVSDTLSSLMTKVMELKTLSTKEEVFVIIKSFGIVHLWVGASIDVHPWSKMSMVYLGSTFRILLRIDTLLTGFCCIKIASGDG